MTVIETTFFSVIGILALLYIVVIISIYRSK